MPSTERGRVRRERERRVRGGERKRLGRKRKVLYEGEEREEKREKRGGCPVCATLALTCSRGSHLRLRRKGAQKKLEEKSEGCDRLQQESFPGRNKARGAEARPSLSRCPTGGRAEAVTGQRWTR